MANTTNTTSNTQGFVHRVLKNGVWYFGPEDFDPPVGLPCEPKLIDGRIVVRAIVSGQEMIAVIPDQQMMIGQIDVPKTHETIELDPVSAVATTQKKLNRCIVASGTSRVDFSAALKQAFENGSATALHVALSFVEPRQRLVLLPNKHGSLSVKFVERRAHPDRTWNVLFWAVALCLYSDALSPRMRWFAASLGLVGALNRTMVRFLGIGPAVLHLLDPSTEPFDFKHAATLVMDKTERLPVALKEKVERKNVITLHVNDPLGRNTSTVEVALVGSKLFWGWSP